MRIDKTVYAEVIAKNALQNVVLKEITNNKGTVVFKLSEVGKYTFSFLDVVDACSYEVKEGQTGIGKKIITYNPKKYTFGIQPNASRTGVVFKTVTATQLKDQTNISKVTINVESSTKVKVPSVVVEVVNVADKVKYKGYTNNVGEFICYIPINKAYEIDIDGSEAVGNFNVPNLPNTEITQTAYYEKMKVNEVTKGDSIFQTNVDQTSGTNSHVLFVLTLKDFENNLLPNEIVCVNGVNKKKIYVGKTDANGVCKLMMAKGDDYLVNLFFEKNIRLIEAQNINGFGTFTVTRRYRGSKIIQEMMAEQKAEMNRIEEMDKEINSGKYIPTYRSTAIQKAAIPTNYLTQTPQGYDLNFKSSGPIGTPTLSNDNLFTKEGFYSTNYYCLKASNGQFVWGVELGESGISPAVLHNGVLLINTASCSLYAIDAATGQLLWSKWLSQYLYSTPTAAGDNVYVAYSHGGKSVLVSFDLKTGGFNWMRTVDDESIACPVIEGNEVHVASQSGAYYVFNKDTGATIMFSKMFKAVSSSTITPNKIYLTALIDGQEQMISLNRKTLELEKKFGPLKAINISDERNIDSPDQMNFNGSHPVVYQNKNIIVTDSEMIHVFDIATEKLLWQKPIITHPNQIPIVANNQIIIATKTNGLISFDLLTGTQTIIQKEKSAVEGQPVSYKGFLYLASLGVLSVVKSVQNYEWGQWNKDASHNLNYK